MLAPLAGRIYDHAPQQNAFPLDGDTDRVRRRKSMRSHDSARMITTTALLSGQLDGLMSAWERSISETATDSVSNRPINLPELEHELSTLAEATAAARTAAEAHSTQADAWDEKARLAANEDRRDLAGVAARRADEHRAAGDALRTEADEMDKVGQSLRATIAHLRKAEQTGSGVTRPAI